MAKLMSDRFILGPQYEYIDWELGKAFDAVKRNFETAWKLPQILSQVEGGYWGNPEGLSGPAVTNSYDNDGQNYATFGGELDAYTYANRLGKIPYTLYYSQSHVPIQFTSEQLEYVDAAEIRRAQIREDEERKAMREAMEWINCQLLGVACNGTNVGTGNFIVGHNTPDIWGFRTILNNANAYYSVNPRPPELNAINQTGITIAANNLYAEIARIMELVAAGNNEIPWLGIFPATWRRYFVSEQINPWRSINRDVNFTLTDWNKGFAIDQINFGYWGNDLYPIFENAMPGSGPGAADNEWMLLNPSKIQVVTMPNRFLNTPVYMQGGPAQPNTWYANMDIWYYMHVSDPACQAYMTSYTLPAIA